MCGPFELSLPLWMDFKGLVWGNHGSALADLNSRHISASKVVTVQWDDDVRLAERDQPKKLVVGLCAGSEQALNPAVKAEIFRVWDTLTCWAVELYLGRPISLLDWFEMHQHGADQVFQDKNTRLEPDYSLHRVWWSGRSTEPAQFADEWRLAKREIRGILEEFSDPEEVQTELFRWVHMTREPGALKAAHRTALAVKLWSECVPVQYSRMPLQWGLDDFQ